MKNVLLLAFVAVLILAGSATSFAQVNVTFVVNTASVPDTIVSTSLVTVTGNKTAITNWGNGDTLVNIGGDYWSKTVQFTTGDSVAFKFRLGGAWENDASNNDGYADGNRTLIVGANDTTLNVEFPNFTGNKMNQYWRPYVESPDTVNIYFRVNMQGYTGTFAPPLDTVGIRGDRKNGSSLAPAIEWGTTHFFTQELANTNFLYNGTNFWHGVIRVPKDSLHAGDTLSYKFIVNADWGRSDGDNRNTALPWPTKDTTIYWAWFNNQKPISRVNKDTVIVTYQVNMTKALNSGGFSTGDTVEVTTGDFGTVSPGNKTKRLLQQIGALYSVKDTVVTSRGQTLDYQYYTNKNGVRTRENYYNFYFTGELAPEAERRQLIVPSSGDLVVRDTATSNINARRQPDFSNNRKLARVVDVTFTVDVRPAIYQVLKGDSLHDIQGSWTITKADSILKWGVWINGLSTGDWAGWGGTLFSDTTRKMWDDGTHGDAVAGDSIFTRHIILNPDTTRGSKGQVGQTFKFGIHGGDNEGGAGGFGNNHNENVVDVGPTYTLASQWGSMNPAFYNAWDYDNHKPLLTGISDQSGQIPLVYTLSQNYPNPFNPTTSIRFEIPKQSVVQLKVYNLLGQVVATLINGELKAGRHEAKFDAAKLASGVYFYRITAGSYVNTMKMMLLK
jgi:hypothetical protein